MLHNYNNEEFDSVALLNSNIIIGFSNVVTSYANSIAICSFTRAKLMANVPNYFDLSKQYYILVATGKLSAGINSIFI